MANLSAMGSDDRQATTCIVYHYYERDQCYRDNLVFFFSIGYRTDLDYYILVAGDLSLELPALFNIKVIRGKNYGHDFGSISAAIASGLDFSRYQHLIFVNCSVRGPLLPSYFEGDWTRLFVDQLRGDVHLCGVTINIPTPENKFHKLYSERYGHPYPFSHVQSFLFAMTQSCFRFAMAKGIWDPVDGLLKNDAIVDREIRLSQEVKANGWNLSCLLSPYRWMDYRVKHDNPNPAATLGSPLAPRGYYGMNLHPYEILFIKTNWGIFSREQINFYSAIAFGGSASLLISTWSEARLLRRRLDEACSDSGLLSPGFGQGEITAGGPGLRRRSSAGRACVLVLGMHRSGTSALTGSLSLMGFKAPRRIMPAHQSNAKGFFESTEVRDFNDQILTRAGGGWGHCSALRWDWLQSSEGRELQARAAILIEEDFAGAAEFVLKDPRLSRLLPFWLPVLAAASEHVLVALVYRHPEEVAKSLQERYGYERDYCLLLWLLYVLEAEAGSRWLERHVLGYHHLIADPQGALEALALGLDIDWPVCRGANPAESCMNAAWAEVQAFISPDLHHQRSLSTGIPARGTIESWCREVFSILERLAAGDVSQQERLQLDRMNSRVHESLSLVGPLLTSSQESLRVATSERRCDGDARGMSSELAPMDDKDPG